MAFPIIDGISLLHWHLNRGKQSIVLDLRTPEGVATYLELVRGADAVIEAMRPGALARRGLGFERMREVEPAHRLLHDLGLRHDRPVQGHAEPRHRLRRLGRRRAPDDRRERLPDASRATRRSASTPGRSTRRSASARRSSAPAPPGSGCRFEVAQSDAAAAFNWNGIEGNKAYERPEDEVTGNDGDGKGAAPAGRRRQHDARRCATSTTARRTASSCSWPRSASSGRTSATASAGRSCSTQNPGAQVRRPRARQRRAAPRAGRDLRDPHDRRVDRSSASEVNTPICAGERRASRSPRDPQFQARLPLRPYQRGRHRPDAVADQAARRGAAGADEAPRVEPGRDTDAVLRDVLGYDAARIAALRRAGALG